MLRAGSVAIPIDEDSVGRKGDCEAIVEMDPRLYDYTKLDNFSDFRSHVEQSSTILEQVTPCGHSFLHVAARHGSEAITGYLARQFPWLIIKQNFQGDTALHLAARCKDLSTTKILVEFNSNVLTVTNRKGNTALHDAVINDAEGVVKLLVSKHREGCLYNNEAGKSPLYLAVEKSSSINNEILDHLLGDDGSSVQTGKQDLSRLLQQQVKSPVHAAVEQRSIELLKKIAAKKPELMWWKDKEKRNPLHYASSTGFVEGVEFLIKKLGAAGATEIDQEGNHPIHAACQRGFLEVVKIFLKIWPDPTEFINQKGQNILHVAAENGREDVVKYILRDKNLSSALLNETDEDGNTPLHLATKRGRYYNVFALIRKKGVHRDVLNNENSTPYDIAEIQSQKAVDEYENSEKCADKESGSEKEKKEDGTKGKQVCLEDAKDGMKNVTPCDKDKSTVVDPKTQSKSKKQINYYGAMITLSILYIFASPRRTTPDDRFPSQGKPLRKEEVKSRIENLLVVAVLVSGATFAGAIQLPQLSGQDSLNNRFAVALAASHNTTSANSSPIGSIGSSLLDAYLYFDVLALNTSVVAAIILIWTHLNDIKFAPFAVWVSSLLVGGSIYTMCLAFFFAVSIAIGDSNYGIIAIIVIVVGCLFFFAQTLLYLQWFLPPTVYQIINQCLSQYVYFSAFVIFYGWKWVPDKLCAIWKKVTN